MCFFANINFVKNIEEVVCLFRRKLLVFKISNEVLCRNMLMLFFHFVWIFLQEYIKGSPSQLSFLPFFLLVGWEKYLKCFEKRTLDKYRSWSCSGSCTFYPVGYQSFTFTLLPIHSSYTGINWDPVWKKRFKIENFGDK